MMMSAMVKKLICDRCGYELAEPGDVDLALQGQAAWQRSVRERGEEPRGVYPCKNYVRCQGEMTVIEERRGLFGRRNKRAKAS